MLSKMRNAHPTMPEFPVVSISIAETECRDIPPKRPNFRALWSEPFLEARDLGTALIVAAKEGDVEAEEEEEGRKEGEEEMMKELAVTVEERNTRDEGTAASEEEKEGETRGLF